MHISWMISTRAHIKKYKLWSCIQSHLFWRFCNTMLYKWYMMNNCSWQMPTEATHMNRKAGRKKRRKDTDGQDSCWLTYIILTGLPLKAIGTLASATYVAMVHTGCSILTGVLLTWVTKLDATASTVHIMWLHTLCYLPIGTARQQTHEHKHISAVDSPLNEVCGVQCWINHLFHLFLPPHLQSSQHEATSLKVKLWCTNFGWMTSSHGQQETPSSSNNTKDVIWQFYHHLLVTSSWGIRRRRKSLKVIQISHPWSWIFDLLIHLF